MYKQHFNTNLYKSFIGVDRLFDLMEDAQSTVFNNNYPPYNIKSIGDGSYEIELAIAGFSKEDISITLDKDQLIIVGDDSKNEVECEYIHRGIASRKFERKFKLVEHTKVKSAIQKDGILSILLKVEVPEELKPTTIEIK